MECSTKCVFVDNRSKYIFIFDTEPRKVNTEDGAGPGFQKIQ